MSAARELLDQLDELRTAGTAGEWQRDGAGNVYVEYRHKGDLYTDGLISAAYTTSSDAALIVAAVNALPQLVGALRAVLALADECDADAGTWSVLVGNRFRDAVTAALATVAPQSPAQP